MCVIARGERVEITHICAKMFEPFLFQIFYYATILLILLRSNLVKYCKTNDKIKNEQKIYIYIY